MFGFGNTSRAAGSLLKSCPKKSQSIRPNHLQRGIILHCCAEREKRNRSLQSLRDTFFQYWQDKCKAPAGISNCSMVWQLIVTLATPFVVKCLVQCYELNALLAHSKEVLVYAIPRLFANCYPQQYNCTRHWTTAVMWAPNFWWRSRRAKWTDPPPLIINSLVWDHGKAVCLTDLEMDCECSALLRGTSRENIDVFRHVRIQSSHLPVSCCTEQKVELNTFYVV